MPPFDHFRARMSYLGNALMAKMAERDWSQTELSRRTNNVVTQSQISQFLGGVHPKRESAEVLFATFGQADGAELLQAWLKDSAPASQQHWVTIVPEGRSVVRDEPNELEELMRRIERMTPRARAVFFRMATAIEARPEVIDAAETMLALIRPRDDPGT